MNRIFSLIAIFVVFSSGGRSQQIVLSNGVKTIGKDTTYFAGQFPVLQIDTCLSQLLENVVDADMNASYFVEGRDKIIYTIDFRDHDEYIDMFVWPMRRSKADKFDYFGVLNIKGTLFLCTDNYRSDVLFHKANEPNIKIELQRPKKMGDMEAIDKAIFQLINNISLYGMYVECTGLKIVTSIYIEGKMTDYKMGHSNKIGLFDASKSFETNKNGIDSTLILYHIRR